MALLAVPATVAVSCKDDGMDVKFTDKGPEMTIESCATEAFMGDSVRFSIKLNDEFPLSTLKAKLLFDGTSVSDLTIRTKTYGTYDAAIFVPLLKDIPAKSPSPRRIPVWESPKRRLRSMSIDLPLRH